jgi:cytochrome c5
MKYSNKTIRGSALFTTSLFTASLLVSGALASTAQAADYPQAGNFSDGSKVWADNCNRCHNMRGPKELRDDQWISTAFHMRSRAGLTGQETRDVITFLQASNTKSVASGSTLVAAVISKGATAKETYDKTCIACHGGDGKGAFPGTPDFTSSDGVLSKSDNVLIEHITNGFQSEGSPMAMPPKGGNPNLDDSSIKAVLSYIRETFGK